MFTFVESVIDEQRDARSSRLIFDFDDLEFIEPVGVVILLNLIEYLKRCGANLQRQDARSQLIHVIRQRTHQPDTFGFPLAS